MKPSIRPPQETPAKQNSAAFCFISTTPNRITGLSSYTDSIVSAYAALHSDQRLLFLTNAEVSIFHSLGKNENITVKKLPKNRFIPAQIYNVVAHFLANIIAYREKSNIYISTTPQASPFPIVAQVFVIHDMYDVDRRFRSPSYVLYTSIMLKLYGLVSRHIVCVSDSTRADATRLLHRSVEKLSVVKEASKYEPVSTEDALGTKPGGRLLYVANIEVTKNVECLLDALRLAEERGVNVQVDWIGRDPRGLVSQWVSKNGSLGNFHSVGVVDDAALASAYRRSSALIVTSFREGFCLPVLEANAHGTPAIVSDIPTLREVAGEAGAFFDPNSPEECLARMVECVASTPAEATARRMKALENARLYAWEKAAREFAAIAERSA